MALNYDALLAMPAGRKDQIFDKHDTIIDALDVCLGMALHRLVPTTGAIYTELRVKDAIDCDKKGRVFLPNCTAAAPTTTGTISCSSCATGKTGSCANTSAPSWRRTSSAR